MSTLHTTDSMANLIEKRQAASRLVSEAEKRDAPDEEFNRLVGEEADIICAISQTPASTLAGLAEKLKALQIMAEAGWGPVHDALLDGAVEDAERLAGGAS